MVFYNPEYFYLFFLLIPLLGLSIYRYIHRRRHLGQEVSHRLWSIVIPDKSFSRGLWKDLFLLLAFSCLVVVLARPQIAGAVSKGDDNLGIEAMICIDISNSMLSTDIAPSRMEATKQMVSKLLDKLAGNKVGIIVFAGKAYTQLPITTDLHAAQDFLDDISPRMTSDQGTAIGDAIRLATQSFSSRADIGKSILVFTDGENHEDQPVEAAKEAKKQGIRVDVVGVGTTSGSPIPIDGGYLKDEQGNIVTTKMNPELCESIAEAGGGNFLSSTNNMAVVTRLLRQLDQLPKGAVNNIGNSGYIEKYRPWLWIALGFLLLELLVLDRRNRFLGKYNIFGNGKEL